MPRDDRDRPRQAPAARAAQRDPDDHRQVTLQRERVPARPPGELVRAVTGSSRARLAAAFGFVAGAVPVLLWRPYHNLAELILSLAVGFVAFPLAGGLLGFALGGDG